MTPQVTTPETHHCDLYHHHDDISGVESAHSGEALLPDVAVSGSRGSGARPKRGQRGENTPLIRGQEGRHRSEYEDLDDEAFNNWTGECPLRNKKC